MKWVLPAALWLASCSGPEPNLGSQDPYERYLGVKELSSRADAEAVAVIVKALDDPHYLVVTGALECLGAIGHREFLQHAAHSVRHAHPIVRAQACATLAALRNEGGVPALVEALKDPEIAVRREAARALGTFGKRPEVLGALVEAVGDADASVALMAHDALTDLTGKPDVPRSREAWAKTLSQ
jgi:HEAT repeat protein